MADAMERVPALREAGIRTTVHGPVSYCADGQPLIGPAPGLRNAWLACGSGFGIGEGAGAGRLLAEWIVEGQPPMHMGLFDPRRFGDYADRRYRVDRAVEVFAMQFATHYPLEERESGTAREGRHRSISRLARAGARFGCVRGWERANWFAGDATSSIGLSFYRTAWFDAVAREVRAVTSHCGGDRPVRIQQADGARERMRPEVSRPPVGKPSCRVSGRRDPSLPLSQREGDR